MNDMRKPVAVPVPGAAPDAALIAMCKDFAAAYTEREALQDRYSAETGDDLPEDLEEPFNNRIDAALDRMLDIKATSLAGVMERAKALFAYDPSMVDPGACGSQGYHDDQARALIRDLLALGADAGNPDAELVALCTSFIALEEAARAEPYSDDETPLEKEVYAKQSAMIGRIYEIRAQTVEGAVMRLRAAVAFCPELMRSGTGTLSEILLTAAIRDLTGEEVQ